MATSPELGPLTHTVPLRGNQVSGSARPGGGIAKAMMYARLGLTSFLGIPVTNADTGHTIGRYVLIGPGTPVLIEGPVIPEVGA